MIALSKELKEVRAKLEAVESAADKEKKKFAKDLEELQTKLKDVTLLKGNTQEFGGLIM